MLAPCFEEHFSADDVRVNEISRIRNAAIDMRFGGKIHDRVELVLREDRLHRLAVGDVALEELVPVRMLLRNAGQVVRVSRVAEHVHVRDEFGLVVLEHEPYKITPNKPAPARDQKTHRASIYQTAKSCGNVENARRAADDNRDNVKRAIRTNYAVMDIKRLHFGHLCLLCMKENLVTLKMTMVEAPGVFAPLPKYLLPAPFTFYPGQRPFERDPGKERAT
jgi:hypothetical protein